jgi:hypothetical protein
MVEVLQMCPACSRSIKDIRCYDCLALKGAACVKLDGEFSDLSDHDSDPLSLCCTDSTG